MHYDLSDYMRDDAPKKQKVPSREHVLYNKWGKAAFRVREHVLYDFKGRPRGFVVGTTIYDIRGEHRGYYQNMIVSDRMRRVIGYAAGATIKGLDLPQYEFPPLVYRDMPPPPLPAGLVELECPPFIAAWSVMQFENLLPAFDDEDLERGNL